MSVLFKEWFNLYLFVSFYPFQLGENKSWNGQNVGFPEPTSSSKYSFLHSYLFLVLLVSVGFRLYKPIEMFSLNLQLGELTPKYPVCEYRCE